MDKFIIDGGEKLYGKIQVQSAKNTVLPLLAAAVLTVRKPGEKRLIIGPFFTVGER